MALTVNEMMSKIDRKETAIANAKEAEFKQRVKEVVAAAKTVMAYGPRLAELSHVVERLIAVKLCMTGADMYNSYESHRKNGYFTTDGWYHWVGYSPRKLSLWGIAGGGACGRSVFYNTANKKFTVCPEYGEATATNWLTAKQLATEICSRYHFSEYDYNAVFHINKMAEKVEQFIGEVETFINELN